MGSRSDECHHHHHRRRHDLVTLPYESYTGAFVGDHYRLQRVRLESDFLDICAVTCLCGNIFEAQAFSLSCPRGSKLLDSRRRRMKRIYRSRNFVAAVEQSGKRYLVSRVCRTEAEWQDVCRQISSRQNSAESGSGGSTRCLAVAGEEEEEFSQCQAHGHSRMAPVDALRPASSSLSSESNPNPLSYARMVARGLKPETSMK